eukprot:TRINITY_DN2944_c0_g1_i12.p2 TRINITY_DN2944_c0_g1~~TRINITY_DN2944_c0_g1_i12.p2  ORF type:complete len:127 (+),score=55.01 TRINITY_DN2944_c0_g1_i12:178-558(+)
MCIRDRSTWELMKKDMKTKKDEKKPTKVEKKAEEKAKASKSKKVVPEPESSDISLSSSSEAEPVAVVQPKTSKKEKVTGKREKVEVAAESKKAKNVEKEETKPTACLLYTSPSPRDLSTSRMPSSA